MIRVLIVDDSLTTREYLRHLIAADPELISAGEAKDGEEALSLAQREKPDVIIMDINMPGINGYEATRAIMETCPTPIVIHSYLTAPGRTDNIFRAMKAGAVAVVQKPTGLGHPEAQILIDKLIRTVKLMAEVKVVRLLKQKALPDPCAPQRRPLVRTDRPATHIIAIGASTGGPPVLQSILENLDRHFPIPIVIVQHIASGFLEGMVEWLSKTTCLPIKIPAIGDPVAGGCIYFTPEDQYVTITASRAFHLTPLENRDAPKRPISCLFSSVAGVYKNAAVGVLLTGMGNDGASGLKEMREQGAVTLVQDKESAIVYGMPGEAVKLGAASFVLPPEDIAVYLNKIAREFPGDTPP